MRSAGKAKGLEHTLDHFLEFWIFKGVKHFFDLLNQPPTPLLTLVNICLADTGETNT